MARGWFGGTSADFIFSVTGGGLVRLAPATLRFYAAKTGGTPLTDLLLNGSPNSVIIVGTDGQIPRFQGPDGFTELWASANGGPRVLMTVPGQQGEPGPPGPPGVNAIENDEAVSNYVKTDGTDTRTELNKLYGSLTNFPVERHGPISELGDNRATIQAALNDARDAGGGIVVPPRGLKLRWSGDLLVPNGVLLGMAPTRQNKPPTDPASIPGLVALDATAQLRVGDWTTDAAPGGICGLYVDGANVGGTDVDHAGLVRIAGVDVQLDRLFAVRSDGDGIVYDGLQNSTVVGGGSTFHQGTALVLDNGPGAVSYHGGYFGTSHGGALMFRDTPGEASLYPWGPVQCNWFGTIFESYDTADFPGPHVAHAHLKCGQNNTFYGVNFTGGADNTHDATVLVDNTDAPVATSVRFDSGTWWSFPGHDYVRVVGNQNVAFTGQQFLSDNGTDHAASVVCVDGGIPHVSMEGELQKASASTPTYRTINGGLTVECYTRHEGGTINVLNASQVVGFRRVDDTGHRAYFDRDGNWVLFDGTLASPVKGHMGRGLDTGFYHDGGLFDIRAGVMINGPQDEVMPATIFAGATATLDAAASRYHDLLWTAGGTTAIDFAGGTHGRTLSVRLTAGGTVPTINWATYIRFAGNTPPALAVNSMTTVHFMYDAAFAKWVEIGRAAAVPIT